MRSFLAGSCSKIAFVLGMAALFATALAYAVWVQPAPAAAGSPIDISGFWQTTLAGDSTGTCFDLVTQNGTKIEVSSSCGSLGGGSRTGSIDVDTGAFTLSGLIGGLFSEVVGVATAEGTSSGTWTAGTLSGTFTGVRQPWTPTPCPGGKRCPQRTAAGRLQPPRRRHPP